MNTEFIKRNLIVLTLGLLATISFLKNILTKLITAVPDEVKITAKKGASADNITSDTVGNIHNIMTGGDLNHYFLWLGVAIFIAILLWGNKAFKKFLVIPVLFGCLYLPEYIYQLNWDSIPLIKLINQQPNTEEVQIVAVAVLVLVILGLMLKVFKGVFILAIVCLTLVVIVKSCNGDGGSDTSVVAGVKCFDGAAGNLFYKGPKDINICLSRPSALTIAEQNRPLTFDFSPDFQIKHKHLIKGYNFSDFVKVEPPGFIGSIVGSYRLTLIIPRGRGTKAQTAFSERGLRYIGITVTGH